MSSTSLNLSKHSFVTNPLQILKGEVSILWLSELLNSGVPHQFLGVSSGSFLNFDIRLFLNDPNAFPSQSHQESHSSVCKVSEWSQIKLVFRFQLSRRQGKYSVILMSA